MTVKCGLCGEEIVSDEKLSEGQHIRCPYCGGKTVYSAPTRIELPTEVKRQKKLKVIKPDAVTSETQKEHELKAVSRRLHMAEDHARFYEEMKDIAQKRKMREKILGIFTLLVFILCAAGLFWFVEYRKEQRRQAEIAYTAERNRLEAERQEKERQERAAREAEEKLRQEKRKTEEKLRREEALRIQAEQEKARNALHEAKVLYRKVCALFADGEFDFISALPKDSLPGKADGEFYYLLPFLDNAEIVVCQSSTNGISSVCRLNESGQKTFFDVETFLPSLQGKDYLVAFKDRVYFQSKRKKPHVAPISKTEVVDLSKEFFGDISQEVKRLDLDPEELKFEIVFIPKETKKVIIADTVEYGAQYSLLKVREAIEDAFPMRSVSTKPSASKKKFKRTVVLWDGAHIKKGVDGTTYVPRVAPPVVYSSSYTYGSGWNYERALRNEYKRQRRAEYTRAQWQALYNEAQEENEAERRFYESQRMSDSQKTKGNLSQTEIDYAARIDRIYTAGTLYFRAKIDALK